LKAVREAIINVVEAAGPAEVFHHAVQDVKLDSRQMCGVETGKCICARGPKVPYKSVERVDFDVLPGL